MKRAGLIGASSLVGECVIPLLGASGARVFAFSRKAGGRSGDHVTWCRLGAPPGPMAPGEGAPEIERWLSLAPIWVLPEHFGMLEACGARRVVALSSTSRFAKAGSSNAAEQAVAARLAEGEERLKAWAEARGVEWVILRPTLIYGRGRDRNIAEIARLIRRFGFFPLLGEARGLRQPVHAEDVAQACVAALEDCAVRGRAFDLSGGETLSYREMVTRVFHALHRRPRFVSLPLPAFRLAVAGLRLFPRFRKWSGAMVERMNRDLVFDHAEAARAFGYSPRPFRPAAADLPDSSPDRAAAAGRGAGAG